MPSKEHVQSSYSLLIQVRFLKGEYANLLISHKLVNIHPPVARAIRPGHSEAPYVQRRNSNPRFRAVFTSPPRTLSHATHAALIVHVHDFRPRPVTNFRSVFTRASSDWDRASPSDAPEAHITNPL